MIRRRRRPPTDTPMIRPRGIWCSSEPYNPYLFRLASSSVL
jgi:hypothetical protein